MSRWSGYHSRAGPFRVKNMEKVKRRGGAQGDLTQVTWFRDSLASHSAMPYVRDRLVRRDYLSQRETGFALFLLRFSRNFFLFVLFSFVCFISSSSYFCFGFIFILFLLNLFCFLFGFPFPSFHSALFVHVNNIFLIHV